MIVDAKFCSVLNDEDGCKQSCGIGSEAANCSWRRQNMSTSKFPGPSRKYSTCSPSLGTCPDGVCDELEQMEPMLCPQDCTESMPIKSSVSGDTVKQEIIVT